MLLLALLTALLAALLAALLGLSMRGSHARAVFTGRPHQVARKLAATLHAIASGKLTVGWAVPRAEGGASAASGLAPGARAGTRASSGRAAPSIKDVLDDRRASGELCETEEAEGAEEEDASVVQFSPYLLAYLPRWKGAAADGDHAAEPARDEERSKQAAAECNIDPDWVGAWVQESVENDKLDEIMKKEGALWLVRKAILSHKREFSVEVSEQGFVLLKTHVPAVTTLAFRIYPSEELAQPTTVAIIGVTGVATAFWEGRALVNKVARSREGRTRSLARWLAGSPACLLACLLGCLAAWLPACLPAYLPACLLAHTCLLLTYSLRSSRATRAAPT